MLVASTQQQPLVGQRVWFAGRLAGMSRKEAGQLVRCLGGTPVESLDSAVNLVVVGEESGEAPRDDAHPSLRQLRAQNAEGHPPEIISETELWQRMGFVEAENDARRLYTPAMLAELCRVPIATVRRWHRRGLIQPVREVNRLPYFDFQEVQSARRLAELLAAGLSRQAIERQLSVLRDFAGGAARSLAQLSVLLEGKELLLRRGEGLIDVGGQFRFDFEPPAAAPAENESEYVIPLTAEGAVGDGLEKSDPQQMVDWAESLDDHGRLSEAAEMYRAALAAGGPDPTICFRLADLLYRQGDLSAARERYYMAIELDERYVEARANLGCVLAESNDLPLAVAAFEGALAHHPDYADVHYHLARALEGLGRVEAARDRWRRFLELAPDSPWAAEAMARVDGESPG